MGVFAIMYTKDKDRQITVRLSQEQYLFLKSSADALEVTPSKFLRMIVNSTMIASRNGVRMVVKNSPLVPVDSEGVTASDGNN